MSGWVAGIFIMIAGMKLNYAETYNPATEEFSRTVINYSLFFSSTFNSIIRKEDKSSYFLFNSVLDLMITHNLEIGKTITGVNASLTYQKFRDSIWIKPKDEIEITFSYCHNFNILSSTFKAQLKSQITDSWKYENYMGELKRSWESGPLLPAKLTAGFGIRRQLQNNDFIYISPLSARFISNKNEYKELEKKHLLTTQTYFIDQEPGMAFQLAVSGKIYKWLGWENKTNLFIKNYNNKNVSGDTFIRLTAEFLKLLQLRCEAKTSYDYLLDESVIFRKEFMLGISLQAKQPKK
jgi:hypothetical protein